MATIEVQSNLGNDMSNFKGWWSFNGNANDSHEFNVDFTEANSPTYLEKDGPTGISGPAYSGAISFSGSEYLFYDGLDWHLNQTGTPFGFSTWYRQKDQSSDQGYYQKIAGVDGFALHYESAAGGYWRFNLGGSLDGSVGDNTNDATTDTWEHVVGWYDPSNTSVNVTKNANSSITTTTSATDPPSATTADFEIGRIFTNGSRMDLAEFTYFDGVPSTEFINALYNGGARLDYQGFKQTNSKTTLSATLVDTPAEEGQTQLIASDISLITTLFNSLILVKHLQLEDILGTSPSFNILVKKYFGSNIDTNTTIFSQVLLKKIFGSNLSGQTLLANNLLAKKYLQIEQILSTSVTFDALVKKYFSSGIATQTSASSRAQLINILQGSGDSGTTLFNNLLRKALIGSSIDTDTTLTAILTVVGATVVNEIISNINTNTDFSADLLRKALIGSGLASSLSIGSSALVTKLLDGSGDGSTTINSSLLKKILVNSGIATSTSASSRAQLINILQGFGDGGTTILSGARSIYNASSYIDTDTTISALLSLITGSTIVEIISAINTSTTLVNQLQLKYLIGAQSTSISVLSPNALVYKYLNGEFGTNTSFSVGELLRSRALNSDLSGSTEFAATLKKIATLLSEIDTDTTISATASVTLAPGDYDPVIIITVEYGDDPVSNRLVGVATEVSTNITSSKPNLTVTSSKPQYISC